MKLIHVKFNSAKLFLSDNNKDFEMTCAYTKDNKIIKSTNSIRKNFVDRNEILKVHCISNMLHVLMGERPIPTYRQIDNGLTRNPRLDEIAKNCFIKLDTPIVYKTRNSKTNEECKWFVTEFIQGKKSVGNSHRNIKINDSKIGSIVDYDKDGRPIRCGSIIEWDTIERKMANIPNRKKTFKDLVALLEEQSGEQNILEKYADSFPRFAIKMRNEGKVTQDFLDKLKKEYILTPLAAYFDYQHEEEKTDKEGKIKKVSNLDKIDSFLYNSGKACLVNYINPLSHVLRLNGSFYFNVTDEEFDKFCKGARVATYLDGGSVTIPEQNTPNIDDILNEGYVTLDELNEEVKGAFLCLKPKKKPKE